jgi:hypothetical protein
MPGSATDIVEATAAVARTFGEDIAHDVCCIFLTKRPTSRGSAPPSSSAHAPSCRPSAAFAELTEDVFEVLLLDAVGRPVAAA